jgi:AcrR family transcriptional regulator
MPLSRSTAINAMQPNPSPTGQRGPVEHERRDQILDAADSYFRTYGYTKTTVADLAKEVGLSTAYIYKFFESKQAIGEAITRKVLGSILAELREVAQRPKPAATRLRLIFQTVARRGADVCFSDRKIHELAVIACSERWQSVRDYEAALLDIIHGLVVDGREAGEFERKTPIAETSQAIYQTLELFANPTFLERSLDDPNGKSESVANLVLRSLAP